MKLCAKCNIEKVFEDFYKNPNGKLYSYCRECHKTISRKWMKKNWDKVLSYAKTSRKNAIQKWGQVFFEKKSICDKRWREENKEMIKEKRRLYQNLHPELKKSDLERMNRWVKENPEKARASASRRTMKRYHSDPLFKVKTLIRNRTKKAIKRLSIKKFKNHMGCTIGEFREHIQKQFKPGMNWNNHGSKGWHYDHVYPFAKCKNEEELIRASHYTNIQPLWWRENNFKRAKILHGVLPP